MSLERRILQQHEEECPLAIIDCEFSKFGCATKLPRKDMPEHVQANITRHMSMLATSHAKQSEEYDKLSVEHANIKLELQRKDEQLEQLRQEQKLLSSKSAFCVPVCVTIHNFSKLRAECSQWESPPFYTRPQGYKMMLEVYPGGYDQHKGVAVFPYLLKGEYDDMLKFPVSMRIIVNLVTTSGCKGKSGIVSLTDLQRAEQYKTGGQGLNFHEANNLYGFVHSNGSIVIEVSKVVLID